MTEAFFFCLGFVVGVIFTLIMGVVGNDEGGPR